MNYAAKTGVVFAAFCFYAGPIQLFSALTSDLSPSPSAAQSALTSSLVFLQEKLMRSEQAASCRSRPKASRADETFSWRDEQAAPPETAIPLEERKFTMVSLLIPGSVRLMICGARTPRGRFMRMPPSASSFASAQSRRAVIFSVYSVARGAYSAAAAEAGDSHQVFGTRAEFLLLPAAEYYRHQRTPLSYIGRYRERPDPFRPVDFVRAESHQIGPDFPGREGDLEIPLRGVAGLSRRGRAAWQARTCP